MNPTRTGPSSAVTPPGGGRPGTSADSGLLGRRVRDGAGPGWTARRRRVVAALTAAASMALVVGMAPVAVTASAATTTAAEDLSGYTPTPNFVRLDTGTTLPDNTLVHRSERTPDGSVRISTSRDLQVLRTDQKVPVTPAVASTDRASHAAAGLPGWSAEEVRTAWWDAHVDDDGTRYAFVCKSDLRIGYGGGWRPQDDCFVRVRAGTGSTWRTVLGGGQEWLDDRPNPHSAPPNTPERRSAEEARSVRLTAPISVALDRQRDILYFTDNQDWWRWTWAFDLTAGTLVRVGEGKDWGDASGMTGLSVRADGTLLAVQYGYGVVVDPVTGDRLRTLEYTAGGRDAWLGDNGDGTAWSFHPYAYLSRSAIDPEPTGATTVFPSSVLWEAIGNARYGPVIDDPAGAVVVLRPATELYSGWGVYRMETAPRAPAPPPDLQVLPADRDLTVEWNPADGYGFPVTGYRVTVTASGATSGKTATVAADAARRVIFDGLTNGTTYRVEVRALSLVGTGSASAVSAVPRDRVAPPRASFPVPVLRSVFSATTGAASVANSAVLAWTPPSRTTVPDLAGVTVVRKQCECVPASPTDGTVLHRGSATGPGTLTVSGLQQGKPYGFAVFTHDTSGNHSSASGRIVRGAVASTTANVADGPGKRILFGSSVAVPHEVYVRSHSGAGVARVPVTLQVRYRTSTGGWTSWSTVTSTATGSYGSVIVSHRPTRNAQYRTLNAATGVHTGAVGPGALLEVAKAVTSSVSATKVRRGSTVTLSGVVKPAHPGTVVRLEHKTATGWSKVSEQKLTSTSGYRFAVKRTGAATVTYRVVSPADADHGTGVTSARTITWT